MIDSRRTRTCVGVALSAATGLAAGLIMGVRSIKRRTGWPRESAPVTAWWTVARRVDARDVWGVMVCNPTGSDVHHVTVTVIGAYDVERGSEIRVETLTPGEHFFVIDPRVGQPPWKTHRFESRPDFQTPPPSSRFGIRMVRFTDAVGQAWSWSPDDGLLRGDRGGISPASAGS